MQADPAQSGCDCRYCTVSLCVAQTTRCAVREVRAVGCIGECKHVGMAHARAAKKVIERGGGGRGSAGFPEDHGRGLKTFGPFATRFPANSRTAKCVRDARFASNAPPIEQVENRE